MMRREHKRPFVGRHWLVLIILSIGLGLLVVRSAYLQVIATDYLQAQGDARHTREIKVTAHRGMIMDRNGEPLAISTPVDSVWIHPKEFLDGKKQWPELAGLLGLEKPQISNTVRKYADREFAYLKRHISPEVAKKVKAMVIPGVFLLREYRRYYPLGEVTGHIVGFTNRDDVGQEGIELAYNQHLSGIDGRKRVLRDRYGRAVEDVERISSVVNGQDLVIGLDSRIQYLAFRYLKSAVKHHSAKSGSAVVLDALSGEILAMVNEPDFNPNNRRNLKSAQFRNRSVTDVFEPGSAIKPFTLALALQSGKFGPDSRIDTAPGMLEIGEGVVRDTHNYGLLTLSRVLVKSSNVGAAKIALELPVVELRQLLDRVGFGWSTQSGLPGEVTGKLPSRKRWREIEHATLAYGYGMSATPLQLAHAYTALAREGRLVPVSLLRREHSVAKVQVLPAGVVRELGKMLEDAASDQGTGKLARIPQYRVAGKTGTVHKLAAKGYADNRYTSIFAGYAPVTDPRLVMVVVVDDPKGEKYFGGEVAAPVFSNVMSEALRILNVPPDIPLKPNRRQQVASTDLDS